MARRINRHRIIRPDVRDDIGTPTSFFVNHHDIRERKAGGKMVYTKVEQLLARGYIKPEQGEAGRRFTNDYLRGRAGRSRSCIDLSAVGGGGDGHLSPERFDASGRYAAAVSALVEADGPKLPGGSSEQLLLMVCIEDTPFVRISMIAGISDEQARSWVCKLLAILSNHYDRVDRVKGRSTTSYTREGALAQFEPELVAALGNEKFRR